MSNHPKPPAYCRTAPESLQRRVSGIKMLDERTGLWLVNEGNGQKEIQANLDMGKGIWWYPSPDDQKYIHIWETS